MLVSLFSKTEFYVWNSLLNTSQQFCSEHFNAALDFWSTSSSFCKSYRSTASTELHICFNFLSLTCFFALCICVFILAHNCSHAISCWRVFLPYCRKCDKSIADILGEEAVT